MQVIFHVFGEMCFRNNVMKNRKTEYFLQYMCMLLAVIITMQSVITKKNFDQTVLLCWNCNLNSLCVILQIDVWNLLLSESCFVGWSFIGCCSIYHTTCLVGHVVSLKIRWLTLFVAIYQCVCQSVRVSQLV